MPKNADNSQDDFTDITNEFIDVDIVCGEDLGILGEPTPFQYSTENLSSFKVPEMISPITSNYTENVQEPTEDAIDELIGDFENMGEYFEQENDTKEDIIQVAETSTGTNSEKEISENNFGTDLYCENSKTFINCNKELTDIYDIVDDKELIKEETKSIKQEPENEENIKNDYSVKNKTDLRRSATKKEAKKLQCCPSSNTNTPTVNIHLANMKVEQEVIEDDEEEPPVRRRSERRPKKKNPCSSGCCLGLIYALMSSIVQSTDSLPIQTPAQILKPSWYSETALKDGVSVEDSFIESNPKIHKYMLSQIIPLAKPHDHDYPKKYSPFSQRLTFWDESEELSRHDSNNCNGVYNLTF